MRKVSLDDGKYLLDWGHDVNGKKDGCYVGCSDFCKAF